MDPQMEEKPIHLVLVDDQALFRASLGRFLASQPGFELAGECGTAAEALEILNSSPVDVVLSDLDLRTPCGENLISAARSAGYEGRFLIVAAVAGARELSTAIKSGASGVFLKTEALERLVQAIRLVASGAVWVDQKAIQLLADRLADQPQQDYRTSGNSLTDTEEKVLLGILGGLTNRKIGENLGTSESSVKGVVQQLFRKAGVRKRGQLVRVALEGSLSVARDLAEHAQSVSLTSRDAGTIR
ncbi:MAG TPA: response regulator transcription factor [Bryobacteraceae bacterium]|jgi:two-component system nitrate/nitrite response regulator NarL|nr:response regulator transcription factor [Bryobacteraceae bacterium]